jgi:lipopolysaccharide transport system permease protein
MSPFPARSAPVAASAPEEREYVIEPNRAWLHLQWAELRDHRDLLLLLIRRDLVTKYKQTILGPLWHLIQPLVMAVVFTAVFSRVAGISTEGVPAGLFYLCSLLGWNYFSRNVSSTAVTFTSNASLFGKVYFPRLIVPLAAVAANVVSLGLQLAVFLVLLMGYTLVTGGGAFRIGWSIVFLPALIAQTAALSLGCGLGLCSLTAKYRDLEHALPFVTSVLMFLSPVLYPSSQIAPGSRWVFMLNPLAPILEGYRRVLLGTGLVEPAAVALSIVVTILVLLCGIMFFQRAERTAIDTV